MQHRGYKINKWDNYNNYFWDVDYMRGLELNYPEHDFEYLEICYFNLKEKYMREQKDFNKKTWDELDEFYKNWKNFNFIK